MATTTPNLNLQKPDLTDNLNLFRQLFNDNMDILDGLSSGVTYTLSLSGTDLVLTGSDGTVQTVSLLQYTATNGVEINGNIISATPFYFTGDTSTGFTPHYV